MWNDALDEQYVDEVLQARFMDFRLDLPNRLIVYTARYAEALAMVASGEVFFAVKSFDGEGGGQGAYQLPLQGAANVWRSYEFPTLQRNSAVTKVTSIDISNNNHKSVDWQPNKGLEELPASTASSLVPPAPATCNAKFKRDSSACVVPTLCSEECEDED
ncbi:uncharacterized protein N7482_004508 [Penicillium canariense]|uniref:Uncharacterized protein n=1 Tax=Penicillium canariense TaxID=189055 RepID=A0A9W9I6I0_9EURO|nr:uncharacterized protein N7482_004508 [Penicillium canariense]KAJ5168914.1 hypothetical protein N7482_004508 [Penicillium canariense]